MLYHHRTDVIVLAKDIFSYYLNKTPVGKEASVTIHYLFGSRPRMVKVVFKNSQLKDQFEAGLKTLKESGQLDAILSNFEDLG